MSNELTTTHHGSSLTLHSDQEFWSERQVAALRQLGVDRANNGDLAVFMHVAQRTGLDPFARQIYMIERQGKQTIQTGIDGFRLVARRVTDRAGGTLALSAGEWCGPDGQWRDVWLSEEPPAAARITVKRDGQEFPGLAVYTEYVQRKRDGKPNAQWTQRPAHMLAKCAEALALRKAFPLDLSGIYTDDEVGHAENRPRDERRSAVASALARNESVGEEPAAPGPGPSPATPQAAAGEGAGESPTPAAPHDGPGDSPAPSSGEEAASPTPEASSPRPARRAQLNMLFAILGELDVADEHRHKVVGRLLRKPVESFKDLSGADAGFLLDTLAECKTRADLEALYEAAVGGDVVDAEVVEDGDQ